MNYNNEMLFPAVKIVFALILVAAALGVVLYFMKRILQKKSIGTKGKMIEVLGTSYIGVKKSILIVDVLGAILVLGVTNENITLLTKIDNRESAGDDPPADRGLHGQID